MQAVKAYYNGDTFTPFKPVKIPKGSHAIVTILDFPINDASNHSELDDVSIRQIEAMRQFITESDNCNEPIPEFERIKLREVEI
ncbi:MAG: hypothetical protein FWC92_06600 [Defluviitaleaceae bacterium]|nr:hypothetical protein [Defluviitaleaceae bacterium]